MRKKDNKREREKERGRTTETVNRMCVSKNRTGTEKLDRLISRVLFNQVNAFFDVDHP